MVWKYFSCVHFWLRFWDCRHRKNKKRKKRVWEAILLHGVSQVPTGFTRFKPLSCQQKWPSVDKTEEKNLLFYSVTVFSHLPISLKCLPLPTASSSYDKKRWFLSGISCNNSWISKRFVKTYMQIIAAFQGALGTELTVETWLTVAQCVCYWVVRTSLLTVSAVGKFKFYLCRVIKCMF